MINKFADAQHLWFWFCYKMEEQAQFRIKSSGNYIRPCELCDMQILLANLMRDKKINTQHLVVMREFFKLKREPNPNVWSENRKSFIWKDGMTALESAARTKGWIETDE